MKQKMKLATQIALVSGSVCLTASCTTSKVYSVVPAQKPSAEEIAMITTLQQTDTTALAQPGMDGQTAVQTAQIQMQPVDLATDRSTAMAYAIPAPKPLNDAAQAIQNNVEVASADPSLIQPVINDQNGQNGVKTRSIGAIAMTDDFGQPELSASNAMLAEKPAQNAEPFVTSTKNTDLNQLISKYAALYDVPETLVHHVVRRESNYNPTAVHHGNWGLMQIRYNTARGLGYDGNPTGLLDAETNLKYAVKYLKGAWIVAEKDAKKADWLYRTGYYYEAKKKQLLDDIAN